MQQNEADSKQSKEFIMAVIMLAYFRCCCELSMAVGSTSSDAKASYRRKRRSKTRLHSAKEL